MAEMLLIRSWAN